MKERLEAAGWYPNPVGKAFMTMAGMMAAGGVGVLLGKLYRYWYM